MRSSILLPLTAILLASLSTGCSLVNAPDDVKAGGEGAGGSGGSDATTTATTTTTTTTTGTTGSGGGTTTSSTTTSSSTGMDCPDPCGADQECVGGQCVCKAGLTQCGDACVDTQTDPNNCGMCGTGCGQCGTCMGGACVAALGAPGAITAGGASTCAFASMTFTIDPVPGASSYTWTVPGDATITNGQGTTSATVTIGKKPGQVCVTAQDACGGSSPSTCYDLTPTVPAPGSQAFLYTGAAQTFIVPSCVNQLKIEAWGAQGGGSVACSPPNQEDGGLGGYAVGIVPVMPGQTLQVMVGAKGGMGPAPASFNGGGPSGQYGGSGGGASDVRTGPDLANRILVAGGGGGGDTGCPDHGTGGPGGGLNGGAGISLQGFPAAGGGTQVAGGAAGQTSSPGQLGLGGGTGGYHESGGGGGYYGGGGAYAAGGGGGSCFLGNAMNGSCSSGVQAGNGKVVLTW